jgi:hypothetical protein
MKNHTPTLMTDLQIKHISEAAMESLVSTKFDAKWHSKTIIDLVATIENRQAAFDEMLAALKETLDHVDNEKSDRVGNQCTLCYTYRNKIRSAIARSEKVKGE